MADTKISALSSATTLGGTELLAGVQSGGNVSITPAQIATYVLGGGVIAIAGGKTLTVSNTLIFTGTDSSSVAFGTGGTVLYNGGALGTPSSATLTSATGLPISTGVSGLGTGVAIALAVNTGSAGAFVVFGGALGTPSSGTATNLTGLPAAGVVGTAAILGANTFTGLQTLAAAGVAFNGSVLLADTANILAARNGANAQTLRVYGTFTDASNGDWLEQSKAAGGGAYIRTVANGTGTASTLSLGTGGMNYWTIGAAGGLTAAADNSYDIGASGATRPRTVYFGTSLNGTVGVGSSGSANYVNLRSDGGVAFSSTTSLAGGIDLVFFRSGSGIGTLSNNAGAFTRLNFGGATASFPALGVSGIVLKAQLADASGPASFQANTLNTSKTTNYSVLAGDTSTHFDNIGAAGEVDFALPTGAVGLTYTFTVKAAQVLKVIAAASTTISIGASTSASAGNISASGAYASVTIYAISTTEWVAKSSTGTWTVT